MKISTWMIAAALALLGGCFQDSTPQRSSFLPLSYPIDPGNGNFTIVRFCRMVTGHPNTYQQVLANPIAADPYTAASYPLPTGSVVVAEQHSDPSCGSLNGYYLMAKEKPGYDSTAGDWHWQKLDIGGRLEQDGKLQTCSACHAKCATSDFLCSSL